MIVVVVCHTFVSRNTQPVIMPTGPKAQTSAPCYFAKNRHCLLLHHLPLHLHHHSVLHLRKCPNAQKLSLPLLPMSSSIQILSSSSD